jgi:DNA-binding response OmpR family regulator
MAVANSRDPDKALRLLVADCEEAVAEIVATELEVCCGAVVTRTGTGMIAARTLQTQHIDLAIIDTSLPDISGFELAELVADCNVPALLISAHPRDQELLTRHGYPHLVKPFRLAALVAAVTSALRNANENVTGLHRAHAMLRRTGQCGVTSCIPLWAEANRSLNDGQQLIPKELWTGASRQLIEALADHWASQGLPARARSVLAYARCRTVEQVRALGRAYFAALENCGAVTLGQIECAVGGWTEGERENEEPRLPRHGRCMGRPGAVRCVNPRRCAVGVRACGQGPCGVVSPRR